MIIDIKKHWSLVTILWVRRRSRNANVKLLLLLLLLFFHEADLGSEIIVHVTTRAVNAFLCFNMFPFKSSSIYIVKMGFTLVYIIPIFLL